MQTDQHQPQPLRGGASTYAAATRSIPLSASSARWQRTRARHPVSHGGARVGWIAGLLLTLAACQSSERYVWGDYEDSVYRVTTSAGEVDVQNELAEMLALVQRAADKDKPVPPGLHAHIGLLYSLAGDSGNAEAAFRTEMALYPESAAFLGGVLERAKGQAGVPQS